MIREFEYRDLQESNELLECFNYQLDTNAFKNPFLKALVYKDQILKGILVYEYFYDRIEIDYIIVNEQYRNNNIATELLNSLEKKYNNINNITLEVRESNVKAINFYLKNGFERVSIRKNYYNQENGILMMKKLGE